MNYACLVLILTQPASYFASLLTNDSVCRLPCFFGKQGSPVVFPWFLWFSCGKQSGFSIPVLRWRFQLNNFDFGFFVYKSQRFRTDTCATGAGGYLGILDEFFWWKTRWSRWSRWSPGSFWTHGPSIDLDRLRFFRRITWSLLKDSGHWYLCVCLFRFTVVHCKTKRGISQN